MSSRVMDVLRKRLALRPIALGAGAVVLGMGVVSRPILVASVVALVGLFAAGAALDLRPLNFATALLGVSVCYAGLNGVLGRPEFAGIVVDWTDMLAVMGVGWSIWIGLRRRPDMTGGAAIAATLLLLPIMWPALVGVVVGHEMQSVLRYGKVVIYYLAAVGLGAWSVAPQLRKYDRILILLAVIAAGYHIFSAGMGWSFESGMSAVVLTSGRVTRGYGWYSAYSLYPAMGVWLTMRRWGDRRMDTLGSVLGVTLLALTGATLIRSLAVAAVACMAVAVSLALRRTAEVRRTLMRLLLVAVATLVALGVLLLAFEYGPADVVERVASVVDSEASSTAALDTRSFRVDAISEGLRVGLRHPFGIGYGPTDRIVEGVGSAVAGSYTTHSAISWLLIRTGVVGLLSFVCGLAWVLLVLFRRALSGDAVDLLNVLLVTSLTVESLGSNALLSNPWTLGLLIIPLSYAFCRRVSVEGVF